MSAKGKKAGQGLPVGAEHNAPARFGLVSEITGELRKLAEQLGCVETAIDHAGEILAISQPPMEGKLGLRWWKLRGGGGGRYREPVIVRWKRQKNGVMSPRIVKHAVARANGSYAVNKAETQACIESLRGLLVKRTALKARLTTIGKMARGSEGISLFVGNEEEKLRNLKIRVVSNLQQAGYEVEERLVAATAK